MKKNIFKSLVTLIALSGILFSCKTPSIEEPVPVEKEKAVMTFVNTPPSHLDGEIYTIITFKKITEVTAINLKTRERFTLLEKDYAYNKESTKLSVTLSKDIPYRKNSLVFHVVGQAENPGEFVLFGYNAAYPKPGIFFGGKLAVEGKDYVLDKASGKVKCLVDLNVEEDSYQISWVTKNGESTFSNRTEKMAAEYQALYNAWKKSIR